MENFFAAISNFGFPVVVAGYLLFRFETKIEKLDESITDPEKGLIAVIKSLENKINDLCKVVDRKK